MAFIGVRSSWLMLARKRLLATLAASAARACLSAVSKRRIRSMAMATWSATVFISASSCSANTGLAREPNESVPITRFWFSSGWQA